MPHACTLDVRSVVRFSDTVLIACSLTVATLHRTLNSRQSAREREGERERERERELARISRDERMHVNEEHFYDSSCFSRPRHRAAKRFVFCHSSFASLSLSLSPSLFLSLSIYLSRLLARATEK
jgi:hypothetical protein